MNILQQANLCQRIHLLSEGPQLFIEDTLFISIKLILELNILLVRFWFIYKIHLHHTAILSFNFTSIFTIKGILYQGISVFWYIDSSLLWIRFHTWCYIYRIAPDIIRKFLAPTSTAINWPGLKLFEWINIYLDG